MYCSKCGALLTEGATFCVRCGTPVGATAIGGPGEPVASPYVGVGAIPVLRNASYAGFWLRFVANIIDGLILGLGIIVLFVPFFFLMGGAALLESLPQHHYHGQPLDPAQMVAFLGFIFTLVALSVIAKWLYYAYLESGEKQATVGKQAMGVYVTDLQGQRLSFGRASGRFFAKIVTGMVPLGIGYIMAGFTERKQALHDMIASTLVLRR